MDFQKKRLKNKSLKSRKINKVLKSSEVFKPKKETPRSKIYHRIRERILFEKSNLAVEETGIELGVITLNSKENKSLLREVSRELTSLVYEPIRQEVNFFVDKFITHSQLINELPDIKERKFYPTLKKELKNIVNQPYQKSFSLDNDWEKKRYEELVENIDGRYEKARKFLKSKHTRQQFRDFLKDFYNNHPIRCKEQGLIVHPQNNNKKNEESVEDRNKRLLEFVNRGKLEKDLVLGGAGYSNRKLYQELVFGGDDFFENLEKSAENEKKIFNIYNNIYWKKKKSYEKKRFSFHQKREDLSLMIIDALKGYTKLKGKEIINWFSDCLEGNKIECLTCMGEGCSPPDDSGQSCLTCIDWQMIISEYPQLEELFPVGSHPQVSRNICIWLNSTLMRRNICGNKRPKFEYDTIFHVLDFAYDMCHPIAKDGNKRSRRSYAR